jgi:hypothetical protein
MKNLLVIAFLCMLCIYSCKKGEDQPATSTLNCKIIRCIDSSYGTKTRYSLTYIDNKISHLRAEGPGSLGDRNFIYDGKNIFISDVIANTVYRDTVVLNDLGLIEKITNNNDEMYLMTYNGVQIKKYIKTQHGRTLWTQIYNWTISDKTSMIQSDVDGSIEYFYYPDQKATYASPWLMSQYFTFGALYTRDASLLKMQIFKDNVSSDTLKFVYVFDSNNNIVEFNGFRSHEKAPYRRATFEYQCQ